MWNSVFREHQQVSPMCLGFLQWDQHSEEQWGLGWRERAICNKCTYKSSMFNMFKEIVNKSPGRKAADINRGLQVGLTQVSMGNAGLRKLLLSASIPAPSTKGMQKVSNKVCKEIIQENILDMRCRRQKLREINIARGNPPDIIDVKGDGSYNNPLYSGVGKTPFQPATQVCYIQAENVTSKNDIIALTTKNKLCSHRIQHQSDELNMTNKTCDCTANISMETNIGDEETWASECLLNLKEDNFEVQNITTDPDTSSYRAAVNLYNEGITQTIPKNFIDTRHFSENHRQYIKRCQNLVDMMPGLTKAARQKMRDRFAIDLSKRCQVEFENAFNKLNRDTDRVKGCLS